MNVGAAFLRFNVGGLNPKATGGEGARGGSGGANALEAGFCETIVLGFIIEVGAAFWVGFDTGFTLAPGILLGTLKGIASTIGLTAWRGLYSVTGRAICRVTVTSLMRVLWRGLISGTVKVDWRTGTAETLGGGMIDFDCCAESWTLETGACSFVFVIVKPPVVPPLARARSSFLPASAIGKAAG